MAATNSASSSAASTPVLNHEAYDPRATAAQGFVIRAAPPKALEAPSHPDEPYPSSSDDEMDEDSSKNGTPSWSASGGDREASFKKKSPSTPYRSVDPEGSVLGGGGPVQPAQVLISFQSVSGKQRKKKLSTLRDMPV